MLSASKSAFEKICLRSSKEKFTHASLARRLELAQRVIVYSFQEIWPHAVLGSLEIKQNQHHIWGICDQAAPKHQTLRKFLGDSPTTRGHQAGVELFKATCFKYGMKIQVKLV